MTTEVNIGDLVTLDSNHNEVVYTVLDRTIFVTKLMDEEGRSFTIGCLAKFHIVGKTELTPNQLRKKELEYALDQVHKMQDHLQVQQEYLESELYFCDAAIDSDENQKEEL